VRGIKRDIKRDIKKDIKRDIKRDIANWPNAILQGRHGEIRDIKRDIVWPNGPLVPRAMILKFGGPFRPRHSVGCREKGSQNPTP
jgi:hypothetical protein